jgi:hypothetical protein
MTHSSRIFHPGPYSDLMPTMTALGVPHFTLRPSTLLRQIMTAFLAGGGGAGGGVGAGAAASRCGEVGREQPAPTATATASAADIRTRRLNWRRPQLRPAVLVCL